MSTPAIPNDGTLSENISTDVCIIGAGIAGMTTAYLLASEGRRVVVVDDGEIGGTMTSRTTAHLVNALDDRYYELERLHGEEGARLAAESHTAAIDRIEQIVDAEGIECEFERLDGFLFVAPEEDDDLDDELAAAHRAGLTELEIVDRAPLEDFDTGRCLRFPQQAQFHPLKYLTGLARGIREKGGLIFAKSHADEIASEDRKVRISMGDVEIVADSVVVATNTPINDRFITHTKQAPYVTYVIGARVKAGTIAKGLYWDNSDPYHYVRLTSAPDSEDHEILIVGGEDHKTGQADDTEERFNCLEQWTRERFLSIEDIEFTWSGQVMEPVDGLAFIGRNPLDDENVYIVTGDSGNGMTHGTIAGILITDLVMGRENPWTKLYDPSRKTLRSLGEFLKENLNVAAQYTDLVTPGDVSSSDEIEPGEGAVIRESLAKIATYKDQSGSVQRMSAVCPHLGCIVDWNTTEKTWDCPCHGSRFDAQGKVFQGPANSDLASA